MTPTERSRLWRLNNLERYRFLQKMYQRKRLADKRVAQGRSPDMIYNKTN
jgi:hypothetical protein